MKKGDITIQVDKQAYRESTLTVKAYFPVVGLAVHREVPPYPKNKYRNEAIRWRRWYISHISSGLKLHSMCFNRLSDAFLACEMIADMLPWTSSADEILKSDDHRKAVVQLIIGYAREGYNETEIASLVLESELKDGA